MFRAPAEPGGTSHVVDLLVASLSDVVSPNRRGLGRGAVIAPRFMDFTNHRSGTKIAPGQVVRLAGTIFWDLLTCILYESQSAFGAKHINSVSSSESCRMLRKFHSSGS